MASSLLRGSCHCGRNQYRVEIPSAGAAEAAQLLFDSDAAHRVSSAAPLSAFIRVPISWYRSQVFPFFPDESRSVIRRAYSHPAEQHVRRNFCGFCGTPLSYWSEQPRSEADYIQLTLGSLLTEDLHGLEELGLVPAESAGDDVDHMDIVPDRLSRSSSQLIGRDFTGIPWFESMLSGSRLGNVHKHTTKGVRRSADGRVRIEYEITEYREDENDEAESSESSATGKRKRGATEDSGATPA
ncbi:hypothetical protein GGR56DRAFT_278795 [Xylariaceae sp. FL0804]|nr:hypothetical protein GGR56DRAFT_278795 [Xylariaceae sp. FL0804]